MPRKNLQKEKDSQSSKKTPQEKALKLGRIPTRSTQLKPLSEQLTLTLKKRKGRQRTQTSLVVFELDEKSIDWILGDEKATVVQNLYEMTREGEKPLFISKRVDVLNRLQNEIPYFVETEVLKEQGAREELQEEVMNLILKHVTDKMQPDTSTYVGTLFTQDDMSCQPFSFGTVSTPFEYFSQPQPTIDIITEEKVDDQTSSRSTPIRTGDMEYEEPEPEQKELDSSFFSRPDSAKHRPFDDLDTSQTSSQKRVLFPIPELQERQTSFYYSKIKDLNTLISCKLTSRFDKIKAKAEQDIGKGTPSPDTKVSMTDFTPESGKRPRDFEEDIFDVYASQEVTKPKFENDIFDSAENMKDNKEISTKLKNIQFEALDASDTQPIIKKLKGPDSVKRGQPIIDPASKLNDIILEYKAGIPGERQIPIQIFGRDLQKLEPNSYINDTIIQFYLKLIQTEFLDDSRKGSVYIYNTYLIEKLRSSTKKGDFGTGETTDFEKTYNSVKKWTKDVDIFEKDFLLFPAHDKNQKHWSLFVVCYPQYFLVKEEAPSQEPDQSTKPKMKPFMLYFDSFKLMDTETAKLIALYLEHEVMNKKPEIYGPIKQAFNSIREYRMHQLIVPLQENYTDCGAYLLEYAERFLMNPDEILDNVEHDRNKLHLFPRSIFKSKRNDIKNLILALAAGDKSVIADYPRKKQQKLEAAMDMPDNFITINDNDFKTYLRTKFDADVQELDSKTRDRAKLGFLIQAHEQRMSRSSDKTVTGNKK